MIFKYQNSAKGPQVPMKTNHFKGTWEQINADKK
jgi:hypothetical protein